MQPYALGGDGLAGRTGYAWPAIADTAGVAGFIGYPRQKVLAVFDATSAADAAIAALRSGGLANGDVERFEGAADADRFDSTGRRHGAIARAVRAIQFGLMDQLPALAWYEAALRQGKAVVAVRTGDRAASLHVVEVLRTGGGHFINRFGRLATEEFVRWQGPEPRVPSLMKH